MSTAKGSRFSHLAPLPALSGLGMLLLLAAVLTGTVASGRLQASAKADFSLTASPTIASAAQGQVATYTLNEQKLNGYNSSVALSASNLPFGATASFSPQVLSSKTSSVLSVTVAGNTTPGNYTVSVTGSGGGLTHSLTITLGVTTAPAPTFTMSANQPTTSILPGDTVAYTISTSALNGFTGTISLAQSGAPATATTTFSPTDVVGGGSSTLQVATKNNTAGGTYTIVVTGTSGASHQTMTLSLLVSATGRQFTITAPSVTVPGPGAGTRLNLRISNPNNQPLQVTNLTVTLASVVKASPSAAGPCSVADYAVTQFSGSYPLTVAAGQTISLFDLGVSSTSWPLLSMLNASSNQDGCKGATVNLSFSGTGQG